MFDYGGVKIAKVIWSLLILFSHVNLKSWSSKKYEDKGPSMYNINQFMTSQNLFYNFLKWISNVIFLQNLVYLRLISKSPQYYKKSRLQWIPLIDI